LIQRSEDGAFSEQHPTEEGRAGIQGRRNC
jgi:hypothetical protein